MINDINEKLRCLKCNTVMFIASNFEVCPHCFKKRMAAEKATKESRLNEQSATESKETTHQG